MPIAVKPVTTHALSGKLYASSSGWILLAVPNALGRGLFEALHEPGIELPDGDKYNAHISVIRPEELEKIGGPSKIKERGKDFRYNLGRLKTVVPSGWGEMARVWFLEVHSPELELLRRTYGLSAIPKEGKFAFHLTIAVRKRNVLYGNDVYKLSDAALRRLGERFEASQPWAPGPLLQNPSSGMSSGKTAADAIFGRLDHPSDRTGLLRLIMEQRDA